jgi:hypothetical protein
MKTWLRILLISLAAAIIAFAIVYTSIVVTLMFMLHLLIKNFG